MDADVSRVEIVKMEKQSYDENHEKNTEQKGKPFNRFVAELYADLWAGCSAFAGMEKN